LLLQLTLASAQHREPARRGDGERPTRRLRRTPVVFLDSDGPGYSAAWLATSKKLLEVTKLLQSEGFNEPHSTYRPRYHGHYLETGTWAFMEAWRDLGTTRCHGERIPEFRGRGGRVLKRPAKIPHTRDVLDFASVHLGTLARLTLHQQNVPGRKATVSPDILDDLTTRVENVQAFFAAYARQRLAEPGRAASVGLVSLCFACSTITRRYDRTPHSEALELANTRAAVLALRATCGSVVAGVAANVSGSETAWARRAGFDGVFVVPQLGEGFTSAHPLTPGAPPRKIPLDAPVRHPARTWFEFGLRIADVRHRGLGDDAAVTEWFPIDEGDRNREALFQRPSRVDFVTWSEQDQALIQRASNRVLIGSVDDFCHSKRSPLIARPPSLGAAFPYRAVAYPPAPVRLVPEQRVARGADLLWNVSCCLPGLNYHTDHGPRVRFPRVSTNDRSVKAGVLAEGVDIILAADVNVLTRHLSSIPCVARRRHPHKSPKRHVFDDCTYADW